jgi:hypothetical protein
VSENKELTRINGHKRKEVMDGENYTTRSFIICTLHRSSSLSFFLKDYHLVEAQVACGEACEL